MADHDIIKFLCDTCGHVSKWPLPFSMMVPRFCQKCGANLFTPPTEEEHNRSVAAMRDSRILNWTLMSEKMPPEGEPCFLASKDPTGMWMVIRVAADARLYRAPGAWWAPDLLGLPFTG